MPSAVLSVKTRPESGTPWSEPVVISTALSGYLAAIFPISETWRKCGVPPRAELVTSMELPFAITSCVWLRSTVGTSSRRKAGRRS
nr:hypothetical protein DWF04_18495 [Cereibacter sphaeroides f. sp. denitrificans]